MRPALLSYGRMLHFFGFSLSRVGRMAAALSLFFPAAPQILDAAPKPKLVVAIIVDQFRYDYLTRFRADYHGGLNDLMTKGADFTNAFYAQVPTVTAVGHSLFLSGAMPAVSGIVSNSWYDRDEGKVVTSVCDWSVKTVGGNQGEQGKQCTDADPASPRRLMVSTVGDELCDAHPDSKVIGVSIKARGAILPAGHRAKGAFWLDDVTGNFVTSSFYMDELPAWANSFNSRKLPAKYVDRKWDGFPDWNFHAATGSRNLYGKLPASPWGNELIEQFAEEAVSGEKLGQRGATDLLTVSFSSNDYVGHRAGPNSPEVRDMALRTDQLLAKLFKLIDQKVGMKDVVVVLSADHGVAARPDHDKETHMPGGYLSGDVEGAIESALNRKFGKADWLIPGGGETTIYLNHKSLENIKMPQGEPIGEEQIYQTASEAIMAMPQLHVARVYTRKQLGDGIAGDFIARAEMNGYYPRRSGDLQIVFDSGFLPGSSGTSHFSPYAYDRHVPVLLMGPGIRPGRYNQTIEVNDIAPTLATMLDVQTPSGSSGRVLTEILAP
jgi:predicted AlkP superfamily pyrophosphatase or phosphodiesterase